MGDYNAALGNSAGPVPLTVGGVTYRLAHLDQGAKGRYETWLESSALRACRPGKDELDPESYRLLLAATREEIRAKEYRWGGARWLASVQTDEGLAVLLWLALLPHQPRTTLGQAAALRDAAYAEDPGDAHRHPELVCTLVELASSGKATLPREKTTAPPAAA
jgi:hypothetical protein